MSEYSAIEWTNATWNPVTGCTKVSPGCKHCYAEHLSERLQAAGSNRYRNGFELTLHPGVLDIPYRWRKPRMVFVNSMSDLFQEGIPDGYIARVFGVMYAAHWHTFQVLTKRAQRMAQWLAQCRGWEGYITHNGAPPKGYWREGIDGPEPGIIVGTEDRWPAPNVWLGVSVEDQKRADERIPDLVATPAAVRFLSCEPLLGPIILTSALCRCPWPADAARTRHLLSCPLSFYGDVRGPVGWPLHWVIVGGESGPGHRPMRPDWARGIRDECTAYGIPFFFKQWGGVTPKSGGRELDGRTWNEMPNPRAAV